MRRGADGLRCGRHRLRTVRQSPAFLSMAVSPVSPVPSTWLCGPALLSIALSGCLAVCLPISLAVRPSFYLAGWLAALPHVAWAAGRIRVTQTEMLRCHFT